MMNKENFVSIDLKTFATPMAILLVGIMISLSIFFGFRSLGLSPTGTGDESDGEIVGLAEEARQQPSQLVKTSIDNDAVLGNRETAKVAIIEFSDYECPFCERFWSQTLGRIKENYIETGKAIFVYRDLPLGFHEPAATREANAAECARKQGGDEIYYQFHDKIYEQTPGNGAGISEGDLVEIGTDLGLNREKMAKCIQDQEFAEEIRKDVEDAGKAGISGTPGFVIGKLDKDGSVEGIIIKGAQPYSNFENAINEQLGS